MSRKCLVLLVVLLAGVSILTAACGATGPAKDARLESGAEPNYQGVAQPVIPKKLKLSEDELKNGIKKFPIKSSTGQQLTPEVEVKDTPLPEKKEQTGDAAKPQV